MNNQLFLIHERASAFNLMMPLMLAKYHFWLIVPGAIGFVIGIAVYYKSIEKKRRRTVAKTISAVGFIALQFGAVGWFIYPLYQYLLSQGSLPPFH
jgi:preprotein translocase subunit Sss1